ncbi:flavodoxin family protein, partial [Candidatus Oleimmundimicrobium sp.]|uniref:flavodoxin family protein n=1 Tax=Candidatus Oleimmundimicrobium sp. TaxID=3060597 RepID=UPI0027198C14
VVGINGSPNKNGNVSYLLEVALDAAKRKGASVCMEHVSDALKGQRKPYCDACSSPCNKSCFKNTSLEKSFEYLKKADAIILASPVYFGNVSSQIKAYWDKTRWLRTEKNLLGKPGGAIAVGASKFGGQETTIRALHDMMLIQGMSIVGDGAKEFDVGHQGVCGVKPTKDDLYAIKRAKILGARIFEEASKVVDGR